MTRKTYCGNLLWQSGLTLLARFPKSAKVERGAFAGCPKTLKKKKF